MNRRRFLKFAGLSAAVIGASAIGLDYLRNRDTGNLQTTSSESMTASSVASPTVTTELQTATSSATEVTNATSGASSLSGRLFFDYNGNGTQDTQEPAVSNAKVRLSDGSGRMIAEALTDSSGDYKFEDIPAGPYSVKVDADKRFRYMCRSTDEIRGIGDGYPVVIKEQSNWNVGLMEGLLTWPFPRGTRFTRHDYLGRDSLFDLDPTIGKARAYDPSIPTTCTGSVCVADGHTGIDIGVNVATHFVSAAPLTVTRFSYVTGDQGKKVGQIFVDYSNGLRGRYAHAQLLSSVQPGQRIRRGEAFGFVEESPVGGSHLHFELLRIGSPIDPYADLLNTDSLSYWTVFNKPQYP